MRFPLYPTLATFLLVCGCSRVQDSPVEDVLSVRRFHDGFMVWRFDQDGVRYTVLSKEHYGRFVILKAESIVPGARHDLPAGR